MNPTESELTPREARVREAVRALPEAKADPAFRNRLAREFATGRILDRPSAVPASPPAWQRVVRWGYIPAAAAAMLVVVLWQNQGPDWKVIGWNGEGTVAIDGQVMAPGDLSALESALHSGTGIALSDGAELTLLSPEVLVVQAASGSRFSVPNPPGRWFGEGIRTRVDGGEVRFLTGLRFSGRKLNVHTVEGQVEVTGTVISVLRDGGVTCVCVLTGTAKVGMNDGDMDPVPAGMRKVMFGDGREPILVDILPEHRAGLLPFVQRYGDFLESETPPTP